MSRAQNSAAHALTRRRQAATQRRPITGERPQVLAMVDYRLAPTVEAVLEERWRVQRVNRTEEALWRLRSGAFATFLLSLHLSSQSSRETLEDVVRAHPEIPVVVVVEPGSEERAAWALSRGAAAYVPTGAALPLLLEPVLERALLSTRLRRVQSGALELEHKEQLRLLALAIRHEINNPLTGILGNAEIALKSGDLPPVLHRRLSNIVKLTEEIRALVQELEGVPEGPSRLWQSGL